MTTDDRPKRIMGRIIQYSLDDESGLIQTNRTEKEYIFSSNDLGSNEQEINLGQLISFIQNDRLDVLEAHDIAFIRYEGHRLYGKMSCDFFAKKYVIKADDGNVYLFPTVNDPNYHMVRWDFVSFVCTSKNNQLFAEDIKEDNTNYFDPEEIKKWMEEAQEETNGGTLFCDRVYIICSRFHSGVENVYKIGRSVNPKRRKDELRKKYLKSMILKHTISTNGGFALENTLHRVFASRLGGGPSWEWFRLKDEDLEWLNRIWCVDIDIFWKVVAYNIGSRRANILVSNYH
jgi:hypothetical protein